MKPRKTMVPRPSDKWRVILWRVDSGGNAAPGRTRKAAFEQALYNLRGASDYDAVASIFTRLFNEITGEWRVGKTASYTSRLPRGLGVEIQRINAGYGY